MMRKQQKQKSQGLTLIELLIFIAVAGIFIVLVFSTLNSFLKSRTTSRRLSTLEQASTYIFNELTQEVHWSDQFIPAGSGRLELIQTQPDESELEVVFNLTDGRLEKQAGLASPEPISSPEVVVHRFEVNDRAGGEIACLEIQLELEYLGSEPKIMANSQTTISLRKAKFKSLTE